MVAGIFSAVAWAVGSLFGNRFLWSLAGWAVFSNWFNAFAAVSAALALGYTTSASSLCRASYLDGRPVISSVGGSFDAACQRHGLDDSLKDPVGDLRNELTRAIAQLSSRVDDLVGVVRRDRNVADQDRGTSRQERTDTQQDIGIAKQQIADLQKAITELVERVEQLEHPSAPEGDPENPQSQGRLIGGDFRAFSLRLWIGMRAGNARDLSPHPYAVLAMAGRDGRKITPRSPSSTRASG